MSMHRRTLLNQLSASALAAAAFGREASAQETVEYGYDALGRLTGVTYSDGSTIAYEYDAAGNRTQVEQNPASSSPPAGVFTATPSAIGAGGSTTLSWTSSSATSASIDNGVGPVTPVAAGSIQVSPAASTTYTLTLTGPGGQTTKQASVTVSAAPTGTFTATPSSISAGGSTTLSWTSSNATSASIDNGVGPVTPVADGSMQVSPASSTTYTLTLNGPGGQTTKQAAVTVSSGFSATIPVTGSGLVNLRSLADAAGYNGAENATVTFQLASGVTITGAAGAPNGGIAIDTGTWPSASYAISLTLQVSGKVYGGGGRGNGGAGGDAIYCRENMSITVSSGGQVKGGGGGGGQGGGWQTSIKDTETGGWGPYEDAAFGGGGGGGFPNGLGGTSPGPGGNGTAGTTTSGGAGGASGAFGTGRTTGAGGTGGGAAAAGASGTSSTGTQGCGAFICRQITSPGGGGQPGYAIRKNGKAVSVTNNGTIVGAQG